MNVRYRVELSQTERRELTGLLSGGKHAVRKLKRAQILLAADAGAGDEEIARSVGVGGSTVYRTKRRFVLGNLEAALSEEPRPGADRKLSRKEEALLVATACSDPPKGRARWTLELLESVRRLYQGLHSFRNMRRMEASLRKARALRLRFSQSLASRRQRFNQAIVRSTIQRLGSGTNPLARSQRLTISVSRLGKTPASAV